MKDNLVNDARNVDIKSILSYYNKGVNKRMPFLPRAIV